MKDTKNVAESSDEKRLNRSPIGIAIMISDSNMTTYLENNDHYVTP
jgi:hypothetical protein